MLRDVVLPKQPVGFAIALGDDRMPCPLGVHRYRCVHLGCGVERPWGALRGAVHRPLETRPEATLCHSQRRSK